MKIPPLFNGEFYSGNITFPQKASSQLGYNFNLPPITQAGARPKWTGKRIA